MNQSADRPRRPRRVRRVLRSRRARPSIKALAINSALRMANPRTANATPTMHQTQRVVAALTARKAPSADDPVSCEVALSFIGKMWSKASAHEQRLLADYRNR